MLLRKGPKKILVRIQEREEYTLHNRQQEQQGKDHESIEEKYREKPPSKAGHV